MDRVWVNLIGTLVVCVWSVMAQSEYVKYKDPSQPIEIRIKDLIKKMTLEEKIGQMTQIERTVASVEVVKKYFIGSVLSDGGSVPNKQASPKDWVDMVNKIQMGALSTRLGIPMIYGIDAVHGHNNAYAATIFPHNIGLGATREPELVRNIAAATALEVRATGIPYAFAPCIAVCRDPRWGRCYESFSEDPRIVRAMTEAIPGLQGDITADSQKGYPFVSGNQHSGRHSLPSKHDSLRVGVVSATFNCDYIEETLLDKVAACAKHYVGDGGTVNGINEGNTAVSFDELLSIHMPAYNDSVSKGVATVMASFSSWNGVKMHANRALLTDFLKNTLNFRGFIITDEKGLDKMTSPPHANYTYSIEASINAGVDMVMVPFNYTEFIDGLSFLVKNNFIPMTRINDAVERILRVKFVMGLFENPLADYSMGKYLGCKEHRELAREAVRKSLVLLKNGNSEKQTLLPLPKKTSKILVTGTHADNIGYQCGGWTVEWQGVSGNITAGTSILTAIKRAVDVETEVVFQENPDASFFKFNRFSYAIVVVGEHPYAESDGDSLNLTIPDPGPSIITNVCGNIKCVVVLITGRPVVVEPYMSTIDALVAAWLPGSEGQGIADVLFGDYEFTGKLPHTWFKTVDQLPMNAGDQNYNPLFPFGFGLTTKPIQTISYHKQIS
ncbi:uncharacterized protein LOC141690241 isoform X1 [Apium graveolens]|uniref:uncharacterized protein LOC141690241 isoform X1 n=1 Tax=Apium graveolens TaxID=4045 RepID=UPI003D7B61F2